MTQLTSLAQARARYFDDERCRGFLEQIRWPLGVRCLRCGSRKLSQVRRLRHRSEEKARILHECASCKYQFSATTGTFLHRSHLPLHHWFVVLWQYQTSAQQISGAWIAKSIGVTYTTAWRMKDRLRRNKNNEFLQELARRSVKGDIRRTENLPSGLPPGAVPL